MKTLAIRLEEEQHAQLSVLAQLAGNTITDEIRQAIETHIEARRANPELTMRAQDVLDEIGRKAQAVQATIATLFGPAGQQAAGSTDSTGKRAARSSEPATNG
jgi:predicted DNA-binding protein